MTAESRREVVFCVSPLSESGRPLISQRTLVGITNDRRLIRTDLVAANLMQYIDSRSRLGCVIEGTIRVSEISQMIVEQSRGE